MIKVSGSIELDKLFFYLINKDYSADWLTPLMILLREAKFWIPLYLFLLVFFIRKEKYLSIVIIVMSLITFAITDYSSAGILKPLIGRIRPCHGLESNSFNNIIGCGGKFSMPSSHAANHFGLATFWFSVIAYRIRKKWYWLWGWAFSVCYAQVYVGVHYPGDMLAGAILGMCTGMLTFFLYRKWVIFLIRNSKKDYYSRHFPPVQNG